MTFRLSDNRTPRKPHPFPTQCPDGCPEPDQTGRYWFDSDRGRVADCAHCGLPTHYFRSRTRKGDGYRFAGPLCSDRCRQADYRRRKADQ